MQGKVRTSKVKRSPGKFHKEKLKCTRRIAMGLELLTTPGCEGFSKDGIALNQL